MRAPGIVCCLLALVPVIVFAAAGDDLEFVGVLVEPGKTSVLLKDKAAGRSRWVVSGETVAGYKFVSYDANSGSVTVSKDNVNGRLSLKTAKVLAGTLPPPPPAPAPAAIPMPTTVAAPVPGTPEAQATMHRAVLNNVRQLAAAADQYYLENGVMRATLGDLVGPTKYVRTLVPVAGEDYSKLEFTQGKELQITLPDGSTLKYSN